MAAGSRTGNPKTSKDDMKVCTKSCLSPARARMHTPSSWSHCQIWAALCGMGVKIRCSAGTGFLVLSEKAGAPSRTPSKPCHQDWRMPLAKSNEGISCPIPRKICTEDEERSRLREPRKGFFLEGGFCKMYASLGCGALGAKCTAGPNILIYILFAWA